MGTVAANVLAHGTGALNVDGCRVGLASDEDVDKLNARSGGRRGFADEYVGGDSASMPLPAGADLSKGRWPANVLLDGSQADRLDSEVGTLKSGKMLPTHTTAGVDGRGTYGKDAAGGFTTMETYGDEGGPSRFFPTFRYQAKAPTRERPSYVKDDGTKIAHPTVKSLPLIEWLVRLVTPPGGLCLDPFGGSDTTAEACIRQGFRNITVEREADYLPLILARIERNRATPPDLVEGDVALFEEPAKGRWPTNVVMDRSQAAELDEQSGVTRSSAHARHNSARPSDMRAGGVLGAAKTGSPADTGGASRFFPVFDDALTLFDEEPPA